MAAANPLLKIPHHPDFAIPTYFADDAAFSYIAQLKKKFERIEKYLAVCDETNFEPFVKDNVLIKVKGIQDALLSVVEEYLKGYPSKAYALFSAMLDDFGVGDEIRSSQQHRVSKNSFLFRTQGHYNTITKKLENKEGFIKAKSTGDLFHPPFQRRRAVSTNRFSISGYPCLYLSETLLTSYSECFPDKKITGSFNVIAVKNSRPLYFIDLSENKLLPDPLSFGNFVAKAKHKNEDVSGILEHLGVYHLVIATHTKIDYKPVYKNEKFYFKAEYIIPQLLLQWVKIEGYAIDGIRYKSCTGTRRFPGKYKHYNYVMPVKTNMEKGFCPVLKRVFTYSSVYSYFKKYQTISIKKILLNIASNLESSKLSSLK